MPKILKQQERPRLVNRGGPGLLRKKPLAGAVSTPPVAQPNELLTADINKIAPALREAGLVVEIESLTLDPMNARIHPEKNMEAIRQSLAQYGQVHPIVIRRQTMIIMAGNGRLEAAKQLGWTEIAAVLVDMTDAEAAGYSLADNRTAELAKWDFEIVAKLDRLIQEQNHDMIGWSADELEILRIADWTPPLVDDSTDDGMLEHTSVKFSPAQWEIIQRAMDEVKSRFSTDDQEDELGEARCLEIICRLWLGESNAKDS